MSPSPIDRRAFLIGATAMTTAFLAACATTRDTVTPDAGTPDTGSGDATATSTNPTSTNPTTSTTEQRPSPTVVLIHGAWHLADPTWHLVQQGLTDAGVPSVAVGLPSAAPTGAARPGVADDAAAVTAAIDQVGGPVVLVGHSYGGVVVSTAGHHPSVQSLVYLAAFALEEGQTVLDIAATVTPAPPIATAIDFRADGLMTIDPAQARNVFYADVPDTLATASIAQLVPSTAAIFTTEQSRPAWLDKSSLYVICNQDNAIPVSREREMARHCTSAVELDSSHSPFLSMPDRVADILIDHVRATT